MSYQAKKHEFQLLIAWLGPISGTIADILAAISAWLAAYDAPLVAHLAAHHTPLSSPQMRGFLQKGRQKVAD